MTWSRGIGGAAIASPEKSRIDSALTIRDSPFLLKEPPTKNDEEIE
jgi:hypothetical protein